MERRANYNIIQKSQLSFDIVYIRLTDESAVITCYHLDVDQGTIY